MQGQRYCEEEITVLAYLAKYNCNKLGYGSRAEIFRKLDEVFERGEGSYKYKYFNILNEYHRAGVPKENESEGTPGVAPNSTTERWTERHRWEKYLLLEEKEWLSKTIEILEMNPGLGRLQPRLELPDGLSSDGETLIRRSNSPEGWIYVLTHPSFPDWIKIGKTRNLNSRLSSYNTGTPNSKKHYKFEYFFPEKEIPHHNAIGVEQSIHRELRPFQNPGDTREWYQMTVKEAIALIIKHQA